MAIVALMMGIPLTLILLAVTFLLKRWCRKRFTPIENRKLRTVLLLAGAAPFLMVLAAYLAGVGTCMYGFFAQEGVSGSSLISIPIVSLIAGSLNLIDFGTVTLGDNGPYLDTYLQSFTLFGAFCLVQLLGIAKAQNDQTV